MLLRLLRYARRSHTTNVTVNGTPLGHLFDHHGLYEVPVLTISFLNMSHAGLK
uniref:Uncharacterized protein n=1 Tax=Anguilla anguilla TaxID=7936 RepID=A0A0E9QDJ6_ANGAN